DCWNSRAFTFNDKAAKALAASKSLSRLDSLFSGCVDEYHGTAYSPGFSKAGLDAIRPSKSMRPAFKAACSAFSGISEYFESAELNEGAELNDHDFRNQPFTLIETEAKRGERRMRQVYLHSEAKKPFDHTKPPKISPSVPEPGPDEGDVVEGLEFVDPTPPA